MTTITIKVNDSTQASLLEKMLRELSFVEAVEIQNTDSNIVAEPEGSYGKIKSALESIDAKDIFTTIDNPSEWQKNNRDEWK
jgi:hypothetical protein